MTSARRSYGAGSPPVDVIVRAARDMLDRDGLEALSMRGLAEHLDIHQPALYRRVGDRAGLLDLIAESIIRDAGLPDVDPADWRAWLLDCAVRLRRSWSAHPHAAPLVYRGGGSEPTLRLFDALFEVFGVAGFDDADAIAVGEIYLGYVFGNTFLEAIPHSIEPKRLDVEQQKRYPHVSHAQEVLIQSRRTGQSVPDSFYTGLEVLLDGLTNRFASLNR